MQPCYRKDPKAFDSLEEALAQRLCVQRLVVDRMRYSNNRTCHGRGRVLDDRCKIPCLRLRA